MDEAQSIGYALVDEQLAACVNILLAVRSIVRWEGEVQEEHAVMMIIKTRRGLFEQLRQRVSELDSYDVPAIVTLPIEAGSPAYLVSGAKLGLSVQYGPLSRFCTPGNLGLML